MAASFSHDEVLRATGATAAVLPSAVGFPVVSTDTRQLSQGCLFVALIGETFDAHDFVLKAAEGGAAGVVVKRGREIPKLPTGVGVYAVDDTLFALGALGRLHRDRFREIPIGAVTGSNGKTTTKEMVGAILETRGSSLKTSGNLNNEIGVPLTLFGLSPSHRAAIIEMGMNNPGEIARLVRIADPDAAVITVVQPAHLKGLGSIEGVAAAKGEIFHGLRPGAIAVVNADDPLIVAQADASGAKQLRFGRAESAEVRLVEAKTLGRDGVDVTIRFAAKDFSFRLGFLGEHNAHNAAAAFALCLALGFTPDECVRGLSSAKPHDRRLNVVDAGGGVTVLDDCYNANPSSMAAGLDALADVASSGKGRALAVLGDMLELGDDEAKEHAALGERAASVCARVAFFGPRSKGGFEKAGSDPKRFGHFTEVEPLLAWLREDLREGDVVLVKGSRGMRLERVVTALTGKAGAAH